MILFGAYLFGTSPVQAQTASNAAIECRENSAMAACVAKAEAMIAKRQFRQAADYLQPACERGSVPACDALWPILLEDKYGLNDSARFYSVFGKSCQAGAMATCDNGSLVASGGFVGEWSGSYVDYRRIRAFAEPGCAQNLVNSCYGMTLLLLTPDSPSYQLDKGLQFARKACDLGLLLACTAGSDVINTLDNFEAAKRSADLYAMNKKACDARQTVYCAGLANIGTMASRVGQQGAVNAWHMFMVDQGISSGDWGASVSYAVNEARSPAATRYAVESAAAAGRMRDLGQNDLYSVQNFYSGTKAGRLASSELSRRANQRAAASAASSSTGVLPCNSECQRQIFIKDNTPLRCYVKDGRRICNK
ncbi:sel1 repeat family protein [Pontixanthobacter aestiaquae]|uniref:Beta-lactamase n=1 Tax=Pontixanthobacter aestiaquae TaxID=1509367 RepID=A0A844Z9A1_9SPHN|nr:sel1 repeat family protein [Pontixanthobacter aestiaquae]MDN3646543.1 sel1 repeat family protein [Pontixanthobacter aestiaquae]MXO82469.1 hypothetical protein [Pontixanthobacter aestiaquae]